MYTSMHICLRENHTSTYIHQIWTIKYTLLRSEDRCQGHTFHYIPFHRINPVLKFRHVIICMASFTRQPRVPDLLHLLSHHSESVSII